MHVLEDKSFRIPVWLDCDPGSDDAFAILLACFSPHIHLVGISTVHGNVLLEKTTKNALDLLSILGFKQGDINVYAGASRPLVVEPLHAEDVHGANGLGNATLPDHPKLEASTDKDYLVAMKDAILKHQGSICVVCTGALTNFANLIQKYPQVCDKIRRVSIMGGGIECGNITPYLEFNIRCDPHAANLVVTEPHLANKIVLCPLNITHTVLATESVRKSVYDKTSTHNSSLRHMFSQILNSYADVYKKKYSDEVGPPVHDPLAVFLLLALVAAEDDKEFALSCEFRCLKRKLKVVLSGDRIGETVIEKRNMDPLYKEDGGVCIGFGVNILFFWRNVLQALDLADTTQK